MKKLIKARRIANHIKLIRHAIQYNNSSYLDLIEPDGSIIFRFDGPRLRLSHDDLIVRLDQNLKMLKDVLK